MGRVTLQRERFGEVIDDALPLLRRHWAEVAHYQDIPLAIDCSGAEQAGMLRIYTARLGEKLVGYVAFILCKNSHYVTSGKQAKQDVLYVAPEHRGVMTGVRLIRFSEEELRAEGVQVVYHHVKLEHPTLAVLLTRVGYEPIETIFGKRLDQPQTPGERETGAGQVENKSNSLAGEPALTGSE
jgi:GNAT superfamily N-acetyltransferase